VYTIHNSYFLNLILYTMGSYEIYTF